MLLPSARDVASDALLFLSRQKHNHSHDNRPHNEAIPLAKPHTSSAYCGREACQRNWKIVFAVILFTEGLIFGYFTLLLRRFACISTRKFRKLLHFVNAGGGGVFLATGLLHILPEATELLAPPEPAEPGAAPHEGHGHGGFPTAYAIVLGTFFLFLLFDRVLFGGSHQHGGMEEKLAHRHSSDIDDADDEEARATAHASAQSSGSEATVYGGARNGLGRRHSSPLFSACWGCPRTPCSIGGARRSVGL
eukprot:IDg11624t1